MLKIDVSCLMIFCLIAGHLDNPFLPSCLLCERSSCVPYFPTLAWTMYSIGALWGMLLDTAQLSIIHLHSQRKTQVKTSQIVPYSAELFSRFL